MTCVVDSGETLRVLGVPEFAAHFGVAPETLSDRCKQLIEQENFSYRIPQGAERDAILLEVLRRLRSDSQQIGADDRQIVWERGWREALNEYRASRQASLSLVPKFIRPNQALRIDREFAIPVDPKFELNFVRVLREWTFSEFLSDVAEAHEFGCGTGFNLVALAEMFPQMRLYGSDFVPASVELVNEIARNMQLRLSARRFDMVSPDADYELAPGSAVFTFGSLEQLASRFEAFLEFLLKRRPKICYHVEPTVELYDSSNLVDYLAIEFHRKRGYTEGFLPRLEALAAEGKVELLRVKRLNFGSLMMEGYSLIVWRPVS